MNKPSKFMLILIAFFLILSIITISYVYRNTQVFDGQRALEYIKFQVELGPRILGSEAHETAAKWIISSLEANKWEVVSQEAEITGVPIKNIIAKSGEGKPWIIIATHYDSRLFADRDSSPEGRKLPVVGANDGASSVAILLELARILPINTDHQIWLVFFDAEDNGNISGYDWILGSKYFITELEGKPDSVIILDMVGDKDLNIYMEQNSDPDLNSEIWAIASELGYTQFIPAYKYNLIDDHIPFIHAGIRAIDVIDFDYPYWHTTHDTLDKISADSLAAVGNTIIKWLEQYSE
jgi:Zn-dependent M28 family amino/carboxypeptidase